MKIPKLKKVKNLREYRTDNLLDNYNHRVYLFM